MPKSMILFWLRIRAALVQSQIETDQHTREQLLVEAGQRTARITASQVELAKLNARIMLLEPVAGVFTDIH